VRVTPNAARSARFFRSRLVSFAQARFLRSTAAMLAAFRQIPKVRRPPRCCGHVRAP
jgi:hypothetical protein